MPEPSRARVLEVLVRECWGVLDAAPIDAEVNASRLLAGLRAAADPAAVGELLGDMVDEAGGCDEPAAVAFVASVGALVPGLAVRAEVALERLRRAGVAAPRWASEVGLALAHDAALVEHAWGDGCTVLLGWVHPGGERHTLGAYVDHNQSGAVTDAFVGPPLAEVLAVVRADLEPGLTVRAVPTDDALAVVRDGLARLDDALTRGTAVDLDADVTRLRALLEVRALAALNRAAAASPPSPRHQTHEPHDLVERFLADRDVRALIAGGVAESTVRSVAESIVAFATTDVTGDLLRASPITVDRYLGGWLTRFPIAAPASAKTLEVLRCWVGFAARHKGFGDELVEPTLAAIDGWRAAGRRPLDARSHFAHRVWKGLGSDGIDLTDTAVDGLYVRLAEPDGADALAALAGGALIDLRDTPAFEPASVPTAVRERASVVVELIEVLCAAALDDECAALAAAMVGALAARPDRVLATGDAKHWAAGVLGALAELNGLGDEASTPHVSSRDLAALVGVAPADLHVAADAVERLLGLAPFDRRFLRRDVVNEPLRRADPPAS